MKSISFRTVAAVAMAAAALSFTACASDDKTSDTSAPGSDTSSSEAAAPFEEGDKNTESEEGKAPAPTTPPNLPKPTAEELNDKIQRALDSNVDEKEKLSWIENAEQDPQLVDKLVAAAKQNNVEVKITNVGEPADGKLKADADVTIGGSPVDAAFVDFVAEEDQWKIAHQFACNIVKSAKLDSAACQE